MQRRVALNAVSMTCRAGRAGTLAHTLERRRGVAVDPAMTRKEPGSSRRPVSQARETGADHLTVTTRPIFGWM